MIFFRVFDTNKLSFGLDYNYHQQTEFLFQQKQQRLIIRMLVEPIKINALSEVKLTKGFSSNS